MHKTVSALLFGLLATSSIAAQEQPVGPSVAEQMAQETLITDGHIDVPYRLRDEWQDVTSNAPAGQFDYARAVKGGLDAPFMSIYTPASMSYEEAAEHAEKMIAIAERMVREAPDKFTIPMTASDMISAFNAGKIALPLGMENGQPIGEDLTKLDYFHKRGIRYITLAHSLPNAISDSSYSEDKPNGGLSPFGEHVVKRMNEIGIMVDVSHISDDAFWDVMDYTDVPVIASHSSARHFTPGFERNMSDDMIKRLGEENGVMMINYGSSFLTEDANQYRPRMEAAYEAYLAESGEEEGSASRFEFRAKYVAENPYPFATLEDVLNHIDHAVALAGIDSVGIGSDYDGVGNTLPIGLKDVASYPNLIAGLMERGYSYKDIRKILSGNLLRVWKAVESAAIQSSAVQN